MRKDIQGLRAIAVIAVLIFHFWPNRLPGGYVGVDIFFVISGFLITLHLLKKPPITFAGLTEFWAKRIRRLLPAATVVLLVTVAASAIWLPETMIQRTVKEAAAAAIYGENWMLASTATNYLDSEDEPSPIQHYWSLSVEEQYYVMWPLLVSGVFIFARGRRWSFKKSLAVALSLVFLISLAWSIYLTDKNPAAAYFVTTTRIWELALGGLVAMMSLRKFELSKNQALTMAWAGIAMIAATLLIFTEKTPFPSYTALLPTVATGMIILASTDKLRFAPGILLNRRSSQFLGDISYSLYLWHWPVVIIAPYALGAPLRAQEKIALIILIIAASAATKRYIEDPARKSKILVLSRPRTYTYGAASILAVVFVSMGLLQFSQNAEARSASQLQAAMNEDDSCIGAGALRNKDCRSISGEKLLMTPAFAKSDKPVLYDDDCWVGRPFTDRKVCTYGKKDSETRIALIGNSHAGMWHAALDKIAVENGWRLDTYLISECYTILSPLAFENADLTRNCTSWNKWAIDSIVRQNYNTVIMSNRTYVQIRGVESRNRDQVAEREYKKIITMFLNAGKKAFIIRDGPEGGSNVPDCVATNQEDGMDICSNLRIKVLKDDPLYNAAAEYKSAQVGSMDLSNRMCDDERCYTVIGGLIAYFDYGHLSDTFVKTLYKDIAPSLVSHIRL